MAFPYAVRPLAQPALVNQSCALGGIPCSDRLPFSALPLTCVRIASFLLTADSEHKHRVELCNESIQRHITACTASDHKLSEIATGEPADERIALQHIDCFYDVFNARWCISRFVDQKMLQYSLEIVRYFWRELDPGHS